MPKFAIPFFVVVVFMLALDFNTVTSLYAADKAPKFWITNFNRERFDSRKYEGKAVLSFFFVGCVPCIKEIPQLHKLISTKYPDTALLFIDPIGEDSPEIIKAFAERLNVPDKYFYHDPLGRLAKKFFKGQFVFPTIIGIEKRTILFRINDIGPESLAKLESALP